jgi:hypothetical protein
MRGDMKQLEETHVMCRIVLHVRRERERSLRGHVKAVEAYSGTAGAVTMAYSGPVRGGSELQ